jgi:hypothetical protein
VPFALLSLAVYGVLFHAEILFRREVYTFRDLYPFFLGMDHLARVLGAFEWPPLWNPFEGLGRPFAADIQTAVFYPPSWLLHSLPAPLGFNLSIVTHHLIAALGAFALLRRRGLDAIPALLGALLFAYGGVFVSLDNLVSALRSAAWLPWAALTFDLWCERKRFLELGIFSMTLALMLLGAMPEFVIIADGLLLALAFDRRLCRQGPTLGRALAGLLGANVMAFGLSAVVLVPFAESVLGSRRSTGLEVEEVLKHSLQPLGVLLFVLPRRFLAADGGLHLTPGVWESLLSRVPWLLTLYLGVGLPFLTSAVRGLPHRRRRGWVLLAAALIGLALGANVPGAAWIVERVPVMQAVRYPEKLLLGVHALLAVACAVGLQWSLARPARLRTVAALAAGIAAALGLFAALTAWAGQPYASDLFQVDLLRQALAFSAAALLAVLGARLPRRVGAAFLVMVALDLFRVNARLLPAVPWDEVVAEPRALAIMEHGEKAPLRIFSDSEGGVRVRGHRENLEQERELLLLQAPSIHGVANLNIEAPVHAGDHDRLRSMIKALPPERLSGVLGFLNVRYVTSPRPLAFPDLLRIRDSSGPFDPFVFENTRSVPRAYVPERLVAVQDADAAIEHLRASDDPAHEVAVEATSVPEGIPGVMSGSVHIERYAPDRIDILARMETAGLVVLGDAFDRGWRAWLNGRETRIVRVNYFVRGVFVVPGEQRVVFRYRPSSHRLGLFVTAATLVLLVAGAWLSVRRWRSA